MTTSLHNVERGQLEILPDGFGFIRLPAEALGYERGDPRDREPYPEGHRDIYVSPPRIRQYGLSDGDQVKCTWRKPQGIELYRFAVEILEVNGLPPAAEAS
jgi:transcription termination factor Rho